MVDVGHRPIMRLSRIVEMNLGFLGIQFSFGLQQANMGPIYRYLGADEASLPLLWLAGPVTGLLVQPIVGAMSDRTVSTWGRRTPYFLIGAILSGVAGWLIFGKRLCRRCEHRAEHACEQDRSVHGGMVPSPALCSHRANP